MALYSLAMSFDPSSNLIPLLEALEIRTGERAALLHELTYINSAAATPVLAFSRSVTPGLGGTQSTFTPDDPASPASTTFAFTGTWARSPTSPGIYTRRYFFAVGNQGGAVMWTWRNGLLIPPQSSVVVWNVTATNPGAADASIVIEE